MSDLVPFDIQIEIIKKLPIISLIRFRTVSKAWTSIIDNSKFIHDNCQRDNQPHHLLVSYDRKYVSIIDDDSFPQNKFYPTVPVTLNRPGYVIKVGCSNGIICLLSMNSDIDCNTDMAVLWNPTIRKSVGIAIPNVLCMPHGYTVIGFGVCPNTNDPKLIKITLIKSSGTDIINCVSWEAEMFTLSSGDWRSIPIGMPSKRTELLWSHVFVNGVIYWCANDWVNAGGENKHNRIISFDLRSEEFGEVFLSDSLVRSTEEFQKRPYFFDR
ncbi:putative F-box protein At5g62660 [Rutidosis leptorrhynchoides]|uniref:putative F-box protein At5g62660 n=1 Tax=Rutidosis leptorrhynchoides TaxID=125765 RepID=UPI003A9A60DB